MSVPSLRWLQIHRYEQFDPVRIEFSGQENLILGINGAGKTRLLRLIRAVLSLDFGELRDHVFDVEFGLETGTALDRRIAVSVHGRVKNDVAERSDGPGEYRSPARTMALGALVLLSSQGSRLSCALKDGQMVVTDGAATFQEALPQLQDGLLFGSLPGPDRGGATAALREMQPLCESVIVSEADQEFQVLTGDVEYSISGYRPGLTQTTVDAPERLARMLRRDLYPLLFQVTLDMGKDTGTAGIVPATFMFGRAIQGRSAIFDGLIERIVGAAGVAQIRFVPKVIREKGELRECRGLGLLVRFVDGTEVAESELTFGQRRYLYAGLMLLYHPGEPLLIDEVDNGLHPRLLETLLTLLAGRQSFLASHNKIVIDYTNFAGPEDVQRKIHIIQRGRDGRQSVLALDDEIARTVYEKMEVAIQSPSDVLLAEGLW